MSFPHFFRNRHDSEKTAPKVETEGNKTATTKTETASSAAACAPTENAASYESELFELIFSLIPNFLADSEQAESFTNRLSIDKGSLLVMLLNYIHKSNHRDDAAPYTEKTASLFSVRTVPLYSEKTQQVPIVVTQIIFPPLPEPRTKITACLRAYICYHRENRTYLFYTIENNRIDSSYYALCRPSVGMHQLICSFAPCPQEQDFNQLISALGDESLRPVTND